MRECVQPARRYEKARADLKIYAIIQRLHRRINLTEKTPMVEYLLIDFDNTMMATEQHALPSLIARFNNLYGAQIDSPLTLHTFKTHFHGQSRDTLCANLSKFFNITVSCDALYADREWIMMQHLHSVSGGIAMAPHLTETLAQLHAQHGIKAALVSNNPIQRALCAMRYASNGKGDTLAALLGTRMFEAGDRQKPLPDPYVRAMAQLDTTPARCLIIEDSVTGTRAGLAAGVTVYGFTGFADDRQAARSELLAAGCRTVFDDWQVLPELML